MGNRVESLHEVGLKPDNCVQRRTKLVLGKIERVYTWNGTEVRSQQGEDIVTFPGIYENSLSGSGVGALLAKIVGLQMAGITSNSRQFGSNLTVLPAGCSHALPSIIVRLPGQKGNNQRLGFHWRPRANHYRTIIYLVQV